MVVGYQRYVVKVFKSCSSKSMAYKA